MKKFEHFGIICFEFCYGQTDRQTNKQSEANVLSTPTGSRVQGDV